MSIEIILSVLAPTITVGAFVVRYFWKKEQCFTLMKQKIDDLSTESSYSQNAHDTIYDKINYLGNRTTALESKMDLIIKHFDIKS